MIAARYRLPEGPPLITMPRDVEDEVERWRERRTALRARQAEAVRARQADPARTRRPRWWRRR